MSAKRKTCSACGKVKAAGAFRHGRNQCIPCRKVVYARWIKANPEEVAARKRRYRETHPKLAAAKVRAFKESNPEKVQAYHRKYNETHREQIKERKHEWYLDPATEAA
jgi:hypothetical protein